MMALPTSVYTGIAKYPLLAIPVFVLAGMVFNALASPCVWCVLLWHWSSNETVILLAINLMVTSRIAGIRIEETVPWVLWLVGAMTTALLLVTFIPELALAVPRALGYLG